MCASKVPARAGEVIKCSHNHNCGEPPHVRDFGTLANVFENLKSILSLPPRKGRMLGLIEREYTLITVVALLAGIFIVASLFLPWLAVTDEESGEVERLNAFQVGESAVESLNLAFVATAFNFLLLFGFLLIFGAVLRFAQIEIGLYLVYAGALLSVVFTVLSLIVSSFVAFASPLIGQWVCLCFSIAGLVSPRLRIIEQKRE